MQMIFICNIKREMATMGGMSVFEIRNYAIAFESGAISTLAL